MDVRIVGRAEDGQAFLRRIAVETNDDGFDDGQGIERFENTLRHLLTRGDATVHVDEHGFDLRITASGGVSSLEDVRRLRDMELYGAIIGKAYYTGALNLKEANEAAK